MDQDPDNKPLRPLPIITQSFDDLIGVDLEKLKKVTMSLPPLHDAIAARKATTPPRERT